MPENRRPQGDIFWLTLYIALSPEAEWTRCNWTDTVISSHSRVLDQPVSIYEWELITVSVQVQRVHSASGLKATMYSVGQKSPLRPATCKGSHSTYCSNSTASSCATFTDVKHIVSLHVYNVPPSDSNDLHFKTAANLLHRNAPNCVLHFKKNCQGSSGALPDPCGGREGRKEMEGREQVRGGGGLAAS